MQSVHLTDERMSVCTGSIVPAVAGVLVEQHAVHRRASVRLSVGPARVGHRSHSTLFNPHPATTARDVTSASPPTLWTVVL